MEKSHSYIIRFQGKFYEIKPKPFEPERMTTDIAWIQLKQKVSPNEAYKIWFEKQRRISRVLQQ